MTKEENIYVYTSMVTRDGMAFCVCVSVRVCVCGCVCVRVGVRFTSLIKTKSERDRAIV